MGRFVHEAKKAISVLRNRNFKPYLKKKNIEGVVFDFWIGDPDGRDWYDIHSTDPVWLEMRFIRDNMVGKGEVVFECGAHHGCTAILLSNWVGPEGKVIAFEALPANCDIIAKNIDLNGLRNVILERKAVGAENGTAHIASISNSSVSPSGKGMEVPLTRLDEYAHLRPAFLKIDVEGFELQVLQGAREILSGRPKLAIEIHTEVLPDYGASVEDLFGLIGVENYDLWIQRDEEKPPERYDGKIPIAKRVHLFGIPL